MGRAASYVGSAHVPDAGAAELAACLQGDLHRPGRWVDGRRVTRLPVSAPWWFC